MPRIFEYVELFYNRRRIHQSLDYETPLLYKKRRVRWCQATLIVVLWFADYGCVIMPRKPRVHFPEALHHVMCRGNQEQSIFKDDRDRGRYLDFLQEGRKRFGHRLYTYVLMGRSISADIYFISQFLRSDGSLDRNFY